jgi:hypothetical protein
MNRAQELSFTARSDRKYGIGAKVILEESVTFFVSKSVDVGVSSDTLGTWTLLEGLYEADELVRRADEP